MTKNWAKFPLRAFNCRTLKELLYNWMNEFYFSNCLNWICWSRYLYNISVAYREIMFFFLSLYSKLTYFQPYTNDSTLCSLLSYSFFSHSQLSSQQRIQAYTSMNIVIVFVGLDVIARVFCNTKYVRERERIVSLRWFVLYDSRKRTIAHKHIRSCAKAFKRKMIQERNEWSGIDRKQVDWMTW